MRYWMELMRNFNRPPQFELLAAFMAWLPSQAMKYAINQGKLICIFTLILRVVPLVVPVPQRRVVTIACPAGL